MLYLASKPCPSAIFHVVHECMWYFNWFIVFPFFFFLIFVQCLANVFSFVCKFCFLEMDSGKSSLLAFCVLEYGILSSKKNLDFDFGMGNWISDGDNDDLLFGNCISNGDNDNSLTLFHEIACQQELQNGYWTLQVALSSWVA